MRIKCWSQRPKFRSVGAVFPWRGTIGQLSAWIVTRANVGETRGKSLRSIGNCRTNRKTNDYPRH